MRKFALSLIYFLLVMSSLLSLTNYTKNNGQTKDLGLVYHPLANKPENRIPQALPSPSITLPQGESGGEVILLPSENYYLAAITANLTGGRNPVLVEYNGTNLIYVNMTTGKNILCNNITGDSDKNNFLVSGNYDSDNYEEIALLINASVYFYDGDGNSIGFWNTTDSEYRNIDSEDLDNDEYDEVILRYYYEMSGTSAIYIIDGNTKTFKKRIPTLGTFELTESISLVDITFGDFDADGANDLFCLFVNSSGFPHQEYLVRVYDGTTFDILANKSLPYQFSHGPFIASDFDKDGADDVNIIIGNYIYFLSGGDLHILANETLSGYEAPDIPDTYLADNDGNGVPEVYTIIMNESSYNQYLFRVSLNFTAPNNISYKVYYIPGVDFIDRWAMVHVTNYTQTDAVFFYNSMIFLYSFGSENVIKSVRVSGSPTHFFEFYYNADDRADILALDVDVLVVIVSDTQPPNIFAYDINPINATIRDAIQINIKVEDQSHVYDPELICYNKITKESIIKPFISLGYFSGYYTFMNYLVGLPEGKYSLDIIVEDSYGNVLRYNSSHPSEPLEINVYGVSFMYFDATNGTTMTPKGFEGLDIDNDSLDEYILVTSNSTHTRIQLFDIENKVITLREDIITDNYTIDSLKTKVYDANGDGIEDFVSVMYCGTGMGQYSLLTITGNSAGGISIKKEDLPGYVLQVYSFTHVNWGENGAFIPVFGTNNGTIFLNGTVIFDAVGYDLISKNVISRNLNDLVILTYNDTATYIALVDGDLHSVRYFNRLVNSSMLEPEGDISASGYFVSQSEETLLVIQFDYDTSQPVLTLINYSNGEIIQENQIDIITTGKVQIIVDDFNRDNWSEVLISNLNFGYVILNRTLGILEAHLYIYTASTTASFWVDWTGDDYNDFIFVEGDVSYTMDEVSAIIYSVDGRTNELSLYESTNTILYIETGRNLIAETNSYQLVGILLDSIRNTYLLTVFWDLNNLYRPILRVEASDVFVDQGNVVDLLVRAYNPFNAPIKDGTIYLHAEYYNESHTYTFTNMGDGTYHLELATARWPLGLVNYTIEFRHSYYEGLEYYYQLLVLGQLQANIRSPSNVTQGEDLIVEILVFDSNYNPISDSLVKIYFQSEVFYANHIAGNYYLANIHTVGIPIGLYALNVTTEHNFAAAYSKLMFLKVKGFPHTTIYSKGINGTGVLQGEIPTIGIALRDNYSNPIDGALITAFFAGKSYVFSPQGDGNYTVILSTNGVPAGIEPCFISIKHSILEPSDFLVNFTIIGRVNLYIETDDHPLQNTFMTVSIEAKDLFGYPIPDLTITVSLGDRSAIAEPIEDTPGKYSAEISLYGVRHGYYNLTVTAEGTYYPQKIVMKQIYVDVQIPQFTLSFNEFLILILISLLASFIGLYIYYRVTQSVKERRAQATEFTSGLKILDKIYIIVLAVFIVTLALAFNYARVGTFDLATALVALSLIEILLLSAIWMFRDTNEILFAERFNLKRFLFGLWHVVMVPILIYLIFYFGVNIEWFEVHIAGDYVNIGITVPKLFISLMGTYIGSYAVIVINIYRESRRLMMRIGEMRSQGTPPEVLRQEKELNISRLSNSIRIKFLMFLVVLGAAIVSTTKLLQFYQVGVVVVIPLIVIVLIPYLASKILSIFNFTAQKIKREIAQRSS